jgi:thiol-disulfide isomerase/thioredoxin/outer membrane lipoprotein-sorting protein
MRVTTVAILTGIALLNAGVAVRADDKADQILKQAATATKAVRSLKVVCVERQTGHRDTPFSIAEVSYMRPNLIRADIWQAASLAWLAKRDKHAPHEIIVSDGVTAWHVNADGTYSKRKAPKFESAFYSDAYSDTTNFFHPNAFMDKNTGTLLRYAGKAIVDGERRDVLLMLSTSSVKNGTRGVNGRATFGPDHLLRSTTFSMGVGMTFDITYRDVKVNPRLTKADFKFKKPAFARRLVDASVSIDVPAGLDAKALELLQKVVKTERVAAALTAEISVSSSYVRSGGTVREPGPASRSVVKLMRPDLARVETWMGGKAPKRTQATDGGTYWDLRDAEGDFHESHPVSMDGLDTTMILADSPFRDFFMPNETSYAFQDTGGKVAYAGEITWNGNAYDVVKVIVPLGGRNPQSATTQLFIDRDGWIRRVISDKPTSGGRRITSEYVVTSLRTDAVLTKADFVVKRPEAAANELAPGLANGTVAPDFSVQDKNGKQVRLSDYAGKVVVIDFWATWCHPCQEGLPIVNKVAHKYKDKGVVVLGINVWDSKKAFISWLPKHKEYDAITFVIDPTRERWKTLAYSLYKVPAIPTQYVIGRDGKIVRGFLGMDRSTKTLEDAIEAALV